MSRSFRRPYAANNGAVCAKADKHLARRGVRRRQNNALRICPDFENLFPPHRYECAWNDVWNWKRDGVLTDRSSLRFSGNESSRKYYL
jgi:hypothetical protein